MYDLDNNVAFIGMYQTMTKKAAITVQVGSARGPMGDTARWSASSTSLLCPCPVPNLPQGCLGVSVPKTLGPLVFTSIESQSQWPLGIGDSRVPFMAITSAPFPATGW